MALKAVADAYRGLEKVQTEELAEEKKTVFGAIKVACLSCFFALEQLFIKLKHLLFGGSSPSDLRANWKRAVEEQARMDLQAFQESIQALQVLQDAVKLSIKG